MAPSMLPAAEERGSDGSTHACSPTASDSSGQPSVSEQRQKSAKRRATEALLQRRFSSPALAVAADAAAAAASAPGATPTGGAISESKRQRSTEQQRLPVRVAACSDCSCNSSGSSFGSGPAAAAATPAWCSQDVALPPMDWAAVLQSVTQEGDVLLLDGAANCYQLPGAGRGGLCREGSLLVGRLGLLRSPRLEALCSPNGPPASAPTRCSPQATSACTLWPKSSSCPRRWARCAPAWRTAAWQSTWSGSQRAGKETAPAASRSCSWPAPPWQCWCASARSASACHPHSTPSSGQCPGLPHALSGAACCCGGAGRVRLQAHAARCCPRPGLRVHPAMPLPPAFTDPVAIALRPLARPCSFFLSSLQRPGAHLCGLFLGLC